MHRPHEKKSGRALVLKPETKQYVLPLSAVYGNKGAQTSILPPLLLAGRKTEPFVETAQTLLLTSAPLVETAWLYPKQRMLLD